MFNDESNSKYESMSIKDLRRLLTLRGFDCSVCLEKGELIAAAQRLDSTDYDQEAHRLFRQLNLEPTLAQRYENLNAIWKHPQDGGGTVYVGNAAAAADRKTLDERHICAIVNCQGNESQNYFEKDPQMTYHRFVVSSLASRVSLVRRLARPGGGITPRQGGFQQAFDFIQNQVQDGKSVLIHCLAGAHRAGTVAVAWIMYQTGKDVSEALALAKKCRPIIRPFGLLLELLHYLEKDLKEQPNSTG